MGKYKAVLWHKETVPCDFGDHKISVVLADDGRYLNVTSECFRNPPSEEERKILKSLKGEVKCCKDTVDCALLAIRMPNLQHMTDSYLGDIMKYASRSATEVRRERQDRMKEEEKENASYQLALTRLVRHVPNDQYSENIGYRAGLEFKLRYVHKDGHYLKLSVWDISSYYGHNVIASRYKGVWTVRTELIDSVVTSLGVRSTDKIHTCKVCKKSVKNIRTHNRSNRHKKTAQQFIFDVMVEIEKRLNKNLDTSGESC